jgi:methylmalonyl-CoA mutase
MNHFMEIAKMRAGRMLWAKLLKQFSQRRRKIIGANSLSNIGLEFNRARSFNNVARTCIEAAWLRHLELVEHTPTP